MYASSREEEEEVVGAQMCPSGKAIDNRTRVEGEREVYKYLVPGGTGFVKGGDEKKVGV